MSVNAFRFLFIALIAAALTGFVVAVLNYCGPIASNGREAVPAGFIIVGWAFMTIPVAIFFFSCLAIISLISSILQINNENRYWKSFVAAAIVLAVPVLIFFLYLPHIIDFSFESC